LNAETVFFVSDIKGVFLDGKVKQEICEYEITEGINNQQITGGMIPKLQSCASLLNSGVNKVWIGNDLTGLLSTGANGEANGTWIVSNDQNENQKILKYPVISKAV
jgi:acetylglutamate kinase